MWQILARASTLSTGRIARTPTVDTEIALGYVEEARVKGLELRRDYVLVRPASREPSRLAEAFLAFCREELAPVRE